MTDVIYTCFFILCGDRCAAPLKKKDNMMLGFVWGLYRSMHNDEAAISMKSNRS